MALLALVCIYGGCTYRRNRAVEMRREMRARQHEEFQVTRRQLNDGASRELVIAKENLKFAGQKLTKGPVSMKSGIERLVQEARASAGFATHRGQTR